MRIRVTRRAEAHIEQAAIWWKQNRPLSPGALDEELAEAFALLISQPAIGAAALNARAMADGKPAHATALFAAADKQFELWNYRMPPFAARERDRDLALLRRHLGETAFETASTQGRAKSLDDAIALAWESLGQ